MSVEAIDAMLRDPKFVAPSRHDGPFDISATARQDQRTPQAHTQPSGAIRFRSLAEIVAERRETRWLIHQVIERGVLAVLAGPRGTFKSFIALDWMMRIAIDGQGVVILSGEGAGLDRRVDAWLRSHSPETDVAKLSAVALERPVNLNVAETLTSVVDACRTLAWKPVAVMIDTLSKFSPGMKENDNGEVAAFLAALSVALRDEFDCTVLLVAHSGHAESGRPRGAYVLTANPDAEYIVERPSQGMIVTVTRDRFKDTAGLPPLAYEARVVDLGRLDVHGEPVTSLALEATDPVLPAAKSKGGLGKNQERGLCALREWVRANPGNSTHITTIDLQSLLKTQGIRHRNRRFEVITFLTSIRVLSPAVAGHAVHAESLT